MAKPKVQRIYLDYAASTPVDPRVLKAMEPYFMGQFGNPGSLHFFGQATIAAVDKARETIARSIGAEFREIIFTSSATEANNLVLKGSIKKFQRDHTTSTPRIIVSSIEHESVLEAARELERDGIEVIYLPVDSCGVVDLAMLKKSLHDNTVLISIMHANNEIGTIQTISDITKIVKDFRGAKMKKSLYPLFHTDAAQSFQFLDCRVDTLGVDLMTISSHKIYGPKGVGALYIKGMGEARAIAPVAPLLFGGGQEFGLRSGTENVPAIVGFAKAVELADAARTKEAKRIEALRAKVWQGIKKKMPSAEINGIAAAHNKKTDLKKNNSLPNILNVYFPGHTAQDLLTKFDLDGLAVSSGSACRSRGFESSYVIEALGYNKQRAKSSIRFSLGRPTTNKEIDAVMSMMPG